MARVTRPIADYATVIAPLIQRRCVICHSPGNVGPFAITGYINVLQNKESIRREVMARNMPPWHVDPEYGKFSNDLSLTPTELAQLVDWIDAGLPRRRGHDPLTEVPALPPKWPAELGEPDQIVTIPVQRVAAYGEIPYRYIFAYATNRQDRWLKAAIVRPGNRAVVHHYVVWEGHSTSAQVSGIALYVPGRPPAAFPEGTGVLLRANSALTFNLHYTAHGHEETDQPELGLWYADAPPARAMKTASPIHNLVPLIPAGAPEHEVATSHLFAHPARLYSFSAHMHLRGLRMRFELVLPGASEREILCSIPNYDFHWQNVYYLSEPRDVPAGARIDVIGAFDNSPQNPRNPDPGVDVGHGEQSWDEMFIGYIEYTE